MATLEPASSLRPLRGRIPDFFIVGHAKSGTTALYEMLRRHPQIFMPDFKEPMFFARNPDVPASVDGPRRFEQTGRRSETLEEYAALFEPAGPGQLAGDGSTFYLFSEPAPARIARAQPGARIIAILREPSAFVVSLHLQMLQNRAESERDLLKALALEDSRRQGRNIPPEAYWPAALMYSDRVRYVEQLQRYHEHFPREQVLVLIYDDFRADNEGTLRRVLGFLGVDADVPLETVEANPSVNVRAAHLDSLLRRVREGNSGPARAARNAVRALTTSRLRESVLYPLRRRVVYGEPPAPDEDAVAELRRRFAPEVAALSEYLGRDLVALWGYDGLV
jgi:hypothetical protein